MNDKLICFKANLHRWKDLPIILTFKDGDVSLTYTRRVASVKGLARFMEQSLNKARKFFNKE